MVIKGRSRSNGKQLAAYLLKNRENDRADVIDIRGTARPDSLHRSLLEMSLTSELSKRGELGLYHAQVNPAIGEDRPMTYADWLKAADILEESLGLEGQKRAIVLHEKNGRVHGHIVWQRYDDETGRFRSDSHNFKKHDQARALIEQELGHERTPQKREREPTHKERLTELWQESPDGRSFIEAAQQAGYYVANGNARRPFRVVTPDGQSLDLMRQFASDTKKEVRAQIKSIRADLRDEAEALQLAKADRQRAAERSQSKPEHSDYSDTISDSQDKAADLKSTFKEQDKLRQQQSRSEPALEKPAAPPLPFVENGSEIVSEIKPENSDLTETAAAMLAAFQQRQSDQQERQRKLKEMQQQAAAQTKKQEEKSLTDQAEEMLQRFRQRQQERGQGRNGPEL